MKIRECTPAEQTATLLQDAARNGWPLMIPGTIEPRADHALPVAVAPTLTALAHSQSALDDRQRLEYERDGGGAPSERRPIRSHPTVLTRLWRWAVLPAPAGAGPRAERRQKSGDGEMGSDMNGKRTMVMAAVCAVWLTQGLDAQSVARYRNFDLGSTVASVSVQAGIAGTEAKTLHVRPAVLEELEWRVPRWTSGSTVASSDPVERMLFSFYNDQLFRIVIDYGHQRTEGMTSADMIEAITRVYGPPLSRNARLAPRIASRIESESGAAAARWGDAEHAVLLYQSPSYGTPFRLMVIDARLENLARQAESQALKLDDQEAPAREVARQQKERDDKADSAAKARDTNKGVFRP